MSSGQDYNVSWRESRKCKTNFSSLTVHGGPRAGTEGMGLEVLGYCSQATPLSGTPHLQVTELPMREHPWALN